MNNSIVSEFRGLWACYSNFFPAPITVRDKVFPTVEHAYHAYKSLRPQDQEWVRMAPTPREAKKRGRQVVLRDDFDMVKIPFMKLFVTMKFVAHEHCRQILVASGRVLLQEGNYWGDTFWGVCKGKGDNNLGIILMEVRDLVRLIR